MKGKNRILMLLIVCLVPWAAKAQIPFSYQEGFESYNNGKVPTGWTVVTSSDANVVSANTYNGNRSFGFLYAQTINQQNQNIVALPYFEIVPGSATISFWSKAEKNNNYCGNLQVGYITDVTNPSTFVPVATYNYTGFVNYNYVENLNLSSMPENARIAFRHCPNQKSYKWYIDDITVSAQEICCLVPTVTVPILTPGNGSLATLRWTENNEANAWLLQYGTDPDFTEGTYQTMDQGFSVTGTTVTAYLTELTPEQTYYARVQSACTSCGQSSQWYRRYS